MLFLTRMNKDGEVKKNGWTVVRPADARALAMSLPNYSAVPRYNKPHAIRQSVYLRSAPVCLVRFSFFFL